MSLPQMAPKARWRGCGICHINMLPPPTVLVYGKNNSLHDRWAAQSCPVRDIYAVSLHQHSTLSVMRGHQAAPPCRHEGNETSTAGSAGSIVTTLGHASLAPAEAGAMPAQRREWVWVIFYCANYCSLLLFVHLYANKGILRKGWGRASLGGLWSGQQAHWPGRGVGFRFSLMAKSETCSWGVHWGGECPGEAPALSILPVGHTIPARDRIALEVLDTHLVMIIVVLERITKRHH